MTNTSAIATEMMARRRELISLQKKNGGCVAIDLKSDNVTFCYNPERKISRSNPSGEKFWITGTMKGSPVTVNESDVYLN